jgi:hypothetical protein
MAPEMLRDGLYTIPGAARRVKVTEASIRSAVYQGGLKDYATREQGMVGIPEGRLMDWFKSRARYRRSA